MLTILSSTDKSKTNSWILCYIVCQLYFFNNKWTSTQCEQIQKNPNETCTHSVYQTVLK